MNLICPVCGCDKSQTFAVARDIEYFTTKDLYSYYQCLDCRVVYISPVPKDILSTIYPPNYYSYQKSDVGLVHVIKRYFDRAFYRGITARLQGESLKVLDIGGGTGSQLDILSSGDKNFSKKIIVDLDESGGALAREKGYDFFHGRFEDYQTDDRFDLILAVNILEHVEDPLSFLQKASSLLSAQGLLVVKTPNHASWDCRLFKNAGWGGFHCPRHWVIFDDKSLRAAAQKAGLRCASLRFTQGAPFWTVGVFDIFRRWGLVHADRENPAYAHPLYKLCMVFFAGIDFARGLFFKTSQMVVLLQRASD